jgi:hypothetical protein
VENPEPKLTKTCSICGEVKPLSAFLQMSDTHATEYGNVCASCRRKAAESKGIPESDESTRSSSGETVDSKSKAQADADKKEAREEIKEEYYEERDEAATANTEKNEKSDQLQLKERFHRESFLNRSSFLTPDKKATQSQVNETKQRAARIVEQAQGIAHAENLEQSAKEELREKGIDLTAPFIDTQIAGKEKYKGLFNSFKTMLGKDAPITRSEQQKNAPQESASDFVEKTWGPTSRKR